MTPLDIQSLKEKLLHLESHWQAMSGGELETLVLETVEPVLAFEGWTLLSHARPRDQVGPRADDEERHGVLPAVLLGARVPPHTVDIVASRVTLDANGTQDLSTLALELHLPRAGRVSDEHADRFVRMASTAQFQNYVLLSPAAISVTSQVSISEAVGSRASFANFDTLRSWLTRIENAISLPPDRVAVALRECTDELVRAIAEDPAALVRIEWREMERVVAAVLSRLGFEVTLTRSGNDGGKDVIAEFYDSGQKRSYIVEVKHWLSARVTGVALKKFLRVVINERHASGLFLSTSGYAGNAYEAIAEMDLSKLRLGDSKKMVSLCRTFVKLESGLWLPGSIQHEFELSTCGGEQLVLANRIR